MLREVSHEGVLVAEGASQETRGEPSRRLAASNSMFGCEHLEAAPQTCVRGIL
jgi:hypothetical protein